MTPMPTPMPRMYNLPAMTMPPARPRVLGDAHVLVLLRAMLDGDIVGTLLPPALLKRGVADGQDNHLLAVRTGEGGGGGVHDGGPNQCKVQ